ncbi:Ankyrin-repeat protein [Orpheovirus IHUMI-LCC2]|uniref:Ankyrin-repeat protein n=1 Tax=Orpheovirus IHUMI-LCC2 TaxID=2023057 RepID=A0A2I2L4A4_9VIRU|nr:Ankyrin-repeat protein [Orpheovirus IHUMI-LCC2]SNW62363.1 Ankyrin-repeat protein [Orpheovirus IHUMI-LCC2]
MNPITDDVFNYLLDNFLCKEERTMMRLLNKKYKNKYYNYINIKTLLKNNNINTVKELYIEDPILHHVFCGLLEYGNIELLDWFIQNNNSMASNENWRIIKKKYLDPYSSAVISNNINVLQWLQNNTNIKSDHYGYKTCLYNGSLEVIKWCHERCTKNKDITNLLPHLGFYHWNLETIKWIHSIYTKLPSYFYEYIIYNMEMVRWLMEEGLVDDDNILTYIIFSICRDGNIELLKMLTLNKKLLNTYFNMAAAEGNLDIMKYLYLNGLRWNDNIFPIVISSCNKIGSDKCIEIMKWLLNPLSLSSSRDENAGIIIDQENACPWGYATYSRCNGNIKVIKWLCDVNCPIKCIYYGVNDPKIFYNNIRDVMNNYSLMLRTGFVLDDEDNKQEIHNLTKILCKNGDIDVLKWLESKECKIPVSDRVIKASCKSGNLELVKWIYEKIDRTAHNYNYGSITAVEYGHVHILEWMIENGIKILYDGRWCKGKYITKKGYQWAISYKHPA